MSINATYRPDEDAATIFSEHTWLQGAFLGSVAYGMEVVLFAMSCYLLWTQRSRSSGKHEIYLLIYISIIFSLSTMYMGAMLQFTQQSFIDDRNIPGGPSEFENIEYSLPVDLLGNAVMVMITWMCDIINVWRCQIIYRTSRVPIWLVCALPMAMYIASIIFGTLFLKQVGSTNGSPWLTAGINWTIPYYSMSLALNILVTILIVGRLLVCRHRIGQVLGKKHGAQYASLAAMIVESAAIYSAFSLLFLIPFAINNTLSQLFLQALSPVQVASTFLIIFRVAQGKGWSSEKVREAMTSTGNYKTPIRIRAVTSTMHDMTTLAQTDTGTMAKNSQGTVNDSDSDFGKKEAMESRA